MANRVYAIVIPVLVLLAAHLVLGMPRPAGIDHGGPPNPDLRERIDAERPDLVMLGSSHLNCGFDPGRFTDATGVPTLNLATPGANTAWQYLVLKNCVLAAEHRPRRVGIWFIDTDLTQPGLGTRGWFKQFIDRYANPVEPLLDRIAYYQEANPLSRFLLRFSSLYQRREEVRDKVEAEVKRAAFLGRMPQASVDEVIRRTFADDRLADDLATVRQLIAERERASGAFAGRVDRSFLPHLVELAREAGIELVFVRLQVRRDLEPGPASPGLDRYLAELRAWLEARDIELIDTTGRAPLGVEHYGQGNHLTPEGMARLTDWLAGEGGLAD